MPKTNEPDDRLHNFEAEQAMLGAMLISNGVVDQVTPFLLPEHFNEPFHAAIYEAITRRASLGQKADAITIIGDLPTVEGIEPRSYIASLVGIPATLTNAGDYGRVVYEMALRRKMVTLGKALTNVAAGGDGTLDETLDWAEGELAALRPRKRGAAGGFAAALQAADDALGRAVRQAEPSGSPWFLREIEWVADSRIEPGDLIGLLGASGDGKTSLTLLQLRHLAESGVPALFLSGEQTVPQCIIQMNAQRVGVTNKDMKDGRLTEEEYLLIRADRDALRKVPLEIETWSGLRVAGLGARIRAFNRRHGRPGVIAIDHARKIMPERDSAQFHEKVFAAYEGLKALATETGNAIIILMQRNSEFLKRRQMRPVRGDAYGGEGALNNLDACLAIYRPSKWLRERAAVEDSGSQAMVDEALRMDGEAGGSGDGSVTMAQVFALKSRFGEEGREKALRFDGPFTRLSSIVRPTLQSSLGLDD